MLQIEIPTECSTCKAGLQNLHGNLVCPNCTQFEVMPNKPINLVLPGDLADKLLINTDLAYSETMNIRGGDTLDQMRFLESLIKVLQDELTTLG